MAWMMELECADEEERRLGIREARETIRYYHTVREELTEYIRSVLWEKK